jgi:hypothetical protein
MESERSLPRSQQPAPGFCPQASEEFHTLLSYSIKIHFNIVMGSSSCCLVRSCYECLLNWVGSVLYKVLRKELPITKE